ncbi:MAG TPA: hypothetical protein VIR79_07030 [Nitrospira sp.]
MTIESGGASDLPRAAVDLLWRGEVIEAIKLVRLDRHIGLKEAKDAVDAYLRSQPALQRKLEQAQAETRQKLGRWLMWLLILAAGAAYFLMQRG